jgi:DNA-binding IscR family transcriptional regulator
MSEPTTISLSDVPGLGPVRREALAEAGVSDLQGLLAMKVAELAAVRGIGLWQARKIREFLRQRGMVLSEDEETGGVVVSNARSQADVDAVADAMLAMEEQAAHEAEVEEEVQLLVAAMEGARAEAQEAAPAPVSPADETVVEEDFEDDDDEEEAESPGGPDWSEEIRAQRERLPEVALSLMEAIRQAAVTRQLTRQITRLLIAAGELAPADPPLTDQRQRKASEALTQVEAALQRAIEKRAFRAVDQKDLADRIRRRRKELERLLEQK